MASERVPRVRATPLPPVSQNRRIGPQARGKIQHCWQVALVKGRVAAQHGAGITPLYLTAPFYIADGGEPAAGGQILPLHKEVPPGTILEH